MRFVSSPLLLILPLILATAACSGPKVEAYLDVGEGDGEVSPDQHRKHIDTQITLIKSSFVLNAALSRRDLAELNVVLHQDDPEAWLLKSLRVSNPKDTSLLLVSLQSEGAVDDLKKILDGVLAAYINEVVAVSRIRSLEKRGELEKSESQLHEELMELLKRRQALKHELQEPKLDSPELEMLDIEIGVKQKIAEELIREQTLRRFQDVFDREQVKVFQQATEVP